MSAPGEITDELITAYESALAVYNQYNTNSTVAATGVSLDKSTATLTVGGDAVALTATVAPYNATDQTVIWSVGGTNASAVKLYTDSTCQTEVGAAATSTLTVYAKGISAGSATVTVACNENTNFIYSCEMTVNAASSSTTEPGKPTVTISPSDAAGAVDFAWDSSYTNDLIFTATANSNYEFDH